MGKRGPKPKTHCKRGHSLSGDNLIFRTRGNMEVRECRSCANQRFRDARRNKKQPPESPDPLEEAIKEVLAEFENKENQTK